MEVASQIKLPDVALWGWPANRTFLRPHELAETMAVSTTTIVRLCQAGEFKIQPTPGKSPRRAAAWKITREAFAVFCHEHRSPTEKDRERLARYRAYKSPHPRKPKKRPSSSAVAEGLESLCKNEKTDFS